MLCATLAFAALFHLIGAWFRRPAVIALVYAFFLETIMGNMPGFFKRVSISFYARCMMYDAAGAYGVQPESPAVYLPVERDDGDAGAAGRYRPAAARRHVPVQPHGVRGGGVRRTWTTFPCPPRSRASRRATASRATAAPARRRPSSPPG